MILTKEQKLEAYTYTMLIHLLETDARIPTFVCIDLKHWYNRGKNIKHRCVLGEVIDHFPEFHAQYPNNNRFGCAWWSDFSPRRTRAIERAIELTEKLPE